MPKFNKVFVPGGAGFVGCLLVPQLLSAGYKVTVFDIMYFGTEGLPDHPNLALIKGDIRDTKAYADAVTGHDAVVSLGCISNDASFELDEELSTSTNLHAFEPMVAAAKEAGVRRFIYCSSSSVYGVSDQPNVTEDHPLVPLTLYNEYKGKCEPILFKYMSDDFECVTLRPATVCGYSPRTRLDVSVNILTNLAVNNGRITVFGGEQMRPNLHIQDMCDLYQLVLELPGEKIQGETFNAGYQNMTINEIAATVKRVVAEEFPDKPEIEIVRTPSDDNRSYHINSDKIKDRIGFVPKYSVEDAVRDLCKAFRDSRLPGSLEDDIYFNVRRLKRLNAA
ncbi:MAG: UDP-glucose 4-epimerase [Alphaproteobacteria bacterium MarineAlpha11_Bin1]|mgnify:CR=1 FL=1|nr:MAG: UDP-glucose 4-epimerase [Alphaproteobacteria bacterium MarineAlpha11_Bin1]|tara:strand:+ start:15513 stop:16520 length:1008 start_codon:yes stop_codon:yes gene_type:complete